MGDLPNVSDLNLISILTIATFDMNGTANKNISWQIHRHFGTRLLLHLSVSVPSYSQESHRFIIPIALFCLITYFNILPLSSFIFFMSEQISADVLNIGWNFLKFASFSVCACCFCNILWMRSVAQCTHGLTWMLLNWNESHWAQSAVIAVPKAIWIVGEP